MAFLSIIPEAHSYIEAVIIMALTMLCAAAIPVTFFTLFAYWGDKFRNDDLDALQPQPDTYPYYGSIRDENAVLNHNGTGWDRVDYDRGEEDEVLSFDREAQEEWEVAAPAHPEHKLEIAHGSDRS